jgi:hypothetical protein
VFFARAPEAISNWTTSGEIAHAVADQPEGPYTVVGTVLKGRGSGYWDGLGLINPRIYKVDGTYALFYTACEKLPSGKQYGMHKDKIGLLISDDLYDWSRANKGEPVLAPALDSHAWDRYVTNNASLVRHPDTGAYWLYYRGGMPREVGIHDSIGLAISQSLAGPYLRVKGNPVVNAVERTNVCGEPFRGFEDPHVWVEKGKFHMLVHDLGYDPEENGGWYFESDDGVNWREPTLGYHGPDYYFGEKGRIETPFVLLDSEGHADYLFVNRDTAGIASGFVFKIQGEKSE